MPKIHSPAFQILRNTPWDIDVITEECQCHGSAAPCFAASCTPGHGGCGSTREMAAVPRRVSVALARVAQLLCLCSAAAKARSWTAAALCARPLLDDAGDGGAMASRELDWSYI